MRTVRMGWLRRPVVLGPLTLGGAVMLDALGVNPRCTVAEKDAALVAYILYRGVSPAQIEDRKRDFKIFQKRVKRHLKDLCKAVNATLQDGFSTYVKPAPEKNAVMSTTPHGIGWWLSYAESLCDDYGWTWHTVLETPLATAFALAAAHRDRYRAGHGAPDYIERKYIKEHFKNG